MGKRDRSQMQQNEGYAKKRPLGTKTAVFSPIKQKNNRSQTVIRPDLSRAVYGNFVATPTLSKVISVESDLGSPLFKGKIQRKAISPTPLPQKNVIQRDSNKLPAVPGEVLPPTYGGMVPVPIPFTHPGQWYSVDRVNSPTDSGRSFWKASVYNAKHLNHQAYKSIGQRNAFYRFAHAYLNRIDGAIASLWFKAAVQATDTDAVGAAESLNVWYLYDNTEVMLKDANAFLFGHNMKNFKYLMEGKDIPGLEGLRGKKLDHALVEFEQTKVKEFIDSYQPKSGTMEDMMEQVNGMFNDPYSIPAILGLNSQPVETVIDKHFRKKDISFDFGNYDHRVTLGKEMVNNLYTQ